MRRSAPHSRTALLDSPSLPVFLGAGMTYALVLFGVCGFRLATPPPTLGAWCVLAFLALFLGLAHGALAALAAALLGRLLAARRWPRGFDALVALGLGTFYAWLGLSLWKYALARSHLRFEDLWFVFRSLRQLGDEGSAQERAILLATVALPLGLAVVFFVALRVARGRQRSSAGTGPVAALAAIALAALMVLCWRYPYAPVSYTHLTLPTNREV